MAMKLEQVLAGLRDVAPEALAEPWDKAGLHLGDPQQEVGRGLVCIDLTEAVVAEAVEDGSALVVAYHPPIFQPLERLTADGPWTQRRILAAARAGVAVYSPHTALDAVRGGVCDWLCDVIADGGGGTRQPITPRYRDQTPPQNFKLVVFVPEADEAALRQALADAGAGGLGHYRECSFSVAGTGGFRPVAGANPAVGRVGRREEVAERRLEMLVPAAALAAVVAALREAHPYEEPAFDVFRLEPLPSPDATGNAPAEGAGRILHLEQPLPPADLAARFTAEQFPEAVVKLGHLTDAPLRRIAVCPGSGGSLFEAVDADAYVTGEMQHHQTLDLIQRGKTVVLLGHTASERPYLPVYANMLRETLGPTVTWTVSKADRAPLRLMDRDSRSLSPN